VRAAGTRAGVAADRSGCGVAGSGRRGAGVDASGGDADELVANSIPAARRLFAFSVPNSRGWRGVAARIGRRLDNSWNGLFRRSCKTFVHDLDRLDRTLTASGFSLRAQETRGLWYVAVYERA